MAGRNRGFALGWVGAVLAAFAPGGSSFAAGAAASEVEGVSSIRITTSAATVSACTSLGEAALSGEDGIALLRVEAARRGADAVRLISFSGRDIRGELYRCVPATPSPSAGPLARPAAPQPASPTPVPTTPSTSPSPSVTSAPRQTPGSAPRQTPGTSLEARRRAASERQKRAQEEFEDLKALVRVTSDPALVAGCEKRGEGRASLENEDALRGDAVGVTANVLLVRKTDTDLRGEYFRCPAAQLQAIPREHAAPEH